MLTLSRRIINKPTDDAEWHLIDWITMDAQDHTAVNRTELLHYCGETFGAAVTPGGRFFIPT
jgi:hypothetical protein